MFLPDGTPAPPFALKAEVSKRQVDLQNTSGALLLLFHSRQTAPNVVEVARAVRETYPSPDQLLIANIADMRIVPRLLRGAVRAFIKSAYNEAIAQIPSGQDPADHIIILSDWDGKLFQAYRIPPTDRQMALVYVNESKKIAGSYIGTQPAHAALSFLSNSRPLSTA